MRMKRFLALLLGLLLCLAGCADGRLAWRGNVAVIEDVFLSEQAFETWFETVRIFDSIMPETLCSMLCIEGAFNRDSALLAFVRYEVIKKAYGESAKEDAQALLAKLDVQENDDALCCATIYCTIDDCRRENIRGVKVTADEVYRWYQDQVCIQMELAMDDLPKAQENYMCGEYEVTTYVPEGLKMIQVLAISTEQRGEAEAFSTAQKVWRNLLYNESFEMLFKQYNDVETYANADGTPKSFCIYETWQEDPAIVLLCENLDQPGQMCGPTMYDGVCYILRFTQSPAHGAIAFELIERQCKDGAIAQKQRQVWAQALDTMQRDAQVRFAPYN